MGKWPILDKIEMIESPIDEKDYEHDVAKLQNRLLDLQVHHLRTGGRVIIGIDGWDAAGKGGLIERIVEGLEPKATQVWRIGPPTMRSMRPPLPAASQPSMPMITRPPVRR